MKNNTKLAIALTLCIIMILSGCTITGRAVGVPDDQIKIGGLFGQTGFAAFAGEASRNGFTMAIEDFESANNVDVEFVLEDFQSDFNKLATASLKLIEQDKVEVIIGPEWNEFAEIVEPISIEHETVFISPWMTGAEKINSPFYFAGTPSERNEMEKLAKYMKSQGVKDLVIILSNNAWSFGNVDFFKDEARKNGLNILDELKVEMDANDFRTEIMKIQQLQPDAIYAVHASDNGAGLFTKQLKEMNVDIQQYIPFARAGSDIFLDNFAEYVDGIIYPSPRKFKNSEAFAAKYRARFGKEPTAQSAASAYDMTTLVLNLMNQGKTSAEEIRQALKELEGFDGFSNHIKFDEHNQIAKEVVLINQVNGKNPIVLA